MPQDIKTCGDLQYEMIGERKTMTVETLEQLCDTKGYHGLVHFSNYSNDSGSGGGSFGGGIFFDLMDQNKGASAQAIKGPSTGITPLQKGSSGMAQKKELTNSNDFLWGYDLPVSGVQLHLHGPSGNTVSHANFKTYDSTRLGTLTGFDAAMADYHAQQIGLKKLGDNK